jgi:hypothetical protein
MSLAKQITEKTADNPADYDTADDEAERDNNDAARLEFPDDEIQFHGGHVLYGKKPEQSQQKNNHGYFDLFFKIILCAP